jgi:hypothetical protein
MQKTMATLAARTDPPRFETPDDELAAGSGFASRVKV